MATFVRASRMGQGAIKIWRIEIVLTRNPDQREQRIAPGVGEGGSHPMWAAVSLTGQTGQSEDTHSPDECASVVVSRISPAASSIEVVCTVAISCRPSDLRTKS